ncbi:MAG: glycosyltransferase family 9 protein [Rhodobacteraceae bacterium]|nr:glycosyltransferase family 9 protein [Paracoccaceae bacterium]
MTQPVLVILPPGLGAAVLCMSALGVIKQHHDPAQLVVISDSESEALLKTVPPVDDVLIDSGAVWYQWRRVKPLRAALQSSNFACVYDLGDGVRGAALFKVMFGWHVPASQRAQIKWCGPMPGTAMTHANPNRAGMHLIDRVADQLRGAGVGEPSPPDLSWVAREVRTFTTPFKMSEPYVLICVDDGPAGPWPAARVVEAAEWIAANRYVPVLIGGTAHSPTAKRVCEAVPRAVDITGVAPPGDLVFLAWGAALAIGPDGGLMTLVATAGCRSIVLCDAGSDPALRGPRGSNITLVRRDSLGDIRLSEIVAPVGAKIASNPAKTG